MEKPAFKIIDLSPKVRQYIMSLALAVSLASGLTTKLQAVEYKPNYDGFIEYCDSKNGKGNSNTVIDTDTEVKCFTELEAEYDKDFQKRSQEQIDFNQGKIAEYDKSIAENQGKIAEYDKSIAEKDAEIRMLQFQIKDNKAQIAKLKVANKNNTGTYEDNLAEIARLEENIRNMDRLIKGMQEFAK